MNKRRTRARRILLALALLGVVGLSGCTTPYGSMGLSLDYHDGNLHLRPHANVGFYGRL
jgi:hypothetical protein